MGSTTCSGEKEKKHHFSIQDLHSIFQFKLDKFIKTDRHGSTAIKSQPYLLDRNKLTNEKDFLDLCLKLLSSSNILYEKASLNHTISNCAVFPSLIEDNALNSKISLNSGEEEYNSFMNKFLNFCSDNDTSHSRKFSFKSKVNNEDEYISIKTNTDNQSPYWKKKLANLNEEFGLEEYLRKEAIRIKKAITFKDSDNPDQFTNDHKHSFEGERDFDVLKNKYLEQTFKNHKRKSAQSGEYPSKIYTSYRNTQTSRKSAQSRNEMNHKGVKQNVHLHVESSITNIKSPNLSRSKINYHSQGNKISYKDLFAKKSVLHDEKKNKSLSKFNSSAMFHTKNNKSLNNNIHRQSSPKSFQLYQNNSLKKGVKNKMRASTRDEAKFSLRIDLRNLMNDEVIKEEVVNTKLSSSKVAASSYSNSRVK